LQDCWRVPLRIYGEREKEDLRPKISTQGRLQPGHLGCQKWTGVGAGGVDEGHRHDLPAQLLEGESLAILGRQAHLWRRPNLRQAVTFSGGVAEGGRKPAHHCQHNEYLNAPPVLHLHAASLPSRVLRVCPSLSSPS